MLILSVELSVLPKNLIGQVMNQQCILSWLTWTCWHSSSSAAFFVWVLNKCGKIKKTLKFELMTSWKLRLWHHVKQLFWPIKLLSYEPNIFPVNLAKNPSNFPSSVIQTKFREDRLFINCSKRIDLFLYPKNGGNADTIWGFGSKLVVPIFFYFCKWHHACKLETSI